MATVEVETEQNKESEANLEGNDLAENMARLKLEGYGVDDDNDPAPENIPILSEEPTIKTSSIYQEWDSCTICHRFSQGLRYEKAKLDFEIPHAPNSTYIDYFIYFLPEAYMKEILLVATNKNDLDNVTWGELLVYIGLWFLMASINTGCDRRAYWENSPVSPWKGAPYRFNEYMTLARFEQITSSLTFTDIPFPQYTDKFHEVRQMIIEFNHHMKEVFIPSWVSCLDESISIWTSRWTCPGWMYVPRKPHPQGNEYHSIACGESGIMYRIELVEGKDRPQEKPTENFFEEHGKTASLLLRLTEGIFDTGKVVILDSGFCVLEALLILKKKGVFASALVKKRRYWPKHIKGDGIKTELENIEVGTTKRLPGELAGVKFDLFCLKEPDYIMILMSTYGSLSCNVNQRDSVRIVNGVPKIFKYNVVVGNHYKYRDAVDAHNAKRHDCGTKNGISLEETWKTSRWPCRVFAFILAIVEVNSYNAMKYFGKYDGTQMQFRRKLAYQLIHNPYDIDGKQKKTHSRQILRSTSHHELISAPPFCKFSGNKWAKRYKMKYQQHACNTIKCKNRVRTVCACSKDIWRCSECFSKHCVEEARAAVP